MLAVAGLAASASDATRSLPAQFALCQAALRIVLVYLYLRAHRHVVQARTLIAVYVVAEGLAGALWRAGAVAPAPGRYGCWAVAVAAEAAAPILATVRSAGLPLHFEHLPERFGLFVILVLGESIAAIAIGVHETQGSGHRHRRRPRVRCRSEPVVDLAVTLVLIGEVVAGLVKQRRGTLTTPAPQSGP
jgi:low temperature requirement protein LtrA